VIRELDNAIINAVRKIFSIADLKAVDEIRVFTGIDRLCELYAVRKYKFYSQFVQAHASHAEVIFRLAVGDDKQFSYVHGSKNVCSSVDTICDVLRRHVLSV
jgi:hypothetical protein